MTIPYAVQKQAEEADRIEKQLAGELEEAPEQQEIQEYQPAEQNEGSIEGEDLQSQLEKAQARYKTLDGMYKADSTRYRQQLEEMNKRLADQERELAEFKRAKELASRESLIKEEDKDLFGEDMVDMVRRAARDEMEKARLSDPNSTEIMRQRLEQMEQRQAQEASAAFYASLSRELPDWETQNTDQGFLQWLAQPDPFSGENRQMILKRAADNLQLQTVVGIFKAYRAEAQNNQAKQTVPLARQVAPSHTRGGPRDTAQTARERIWTQEEIAEFYTACRKHELTPEAEAQIEKEIDLAVAEGRVR